MDPSFKPFKADLDALLTPISAEQAAGESLRYDETYDLIKEARREDDPNLPQGIYVTELKRADWALVEKLCTEALSTRSKDLQLAAWLMEAWIHRYGYTGAREGLILVRGLIEGFWEHLYPLIEDGDLATRLVPIEWIDAKLSITLKQLPITQPDVGDLKAYSFADREWASQQAPQTAQRQDASDPDRLTHARFLNSMTMTATPYFRKLYSITGEVHEEALALEEVLAEQCGEPMDLLYTFRGVLQDVRAYAKQVLDERDEQAPVPSKETTFEDMPTLEAGDESGQPGQPARAGGPIRSRADAYRMLLEAADYLAKTEPHSPTPYLVRRAVSWGGMTLIEVMQELVKSQGDLMEIYELLGVREEE